MQRKGGDANRQKRLIGIGVFVAMVGFSTIAMGGSAVLVMVRVGIAVLTGLVVSALFRAYDKDDRQR